MVSIHPSVLIITNERDASVDWVVRELRKREVPYLRLNTERMTRFALEIDPSGRAWRLTSDQEEFVLDQVTGVWFRRPECSTDVRNSQLTSAQQDFACEQLRSVVSGLSVLGVDKWINFPSRNQSAASKIWQLWAASQFGFLVPESLITNSREKALHFLQTMPGGTVLKSLHAPLLDEPGAPSFVYTQRVTETQIQSMAQTELIPFILQKEIWPKIDIRVTVIDDRVLAAAAEPHEYLDWRTGVPEVSFHHHQLPISIERQCIAFLNALGLRFGAFDFALSGNGNYHFLEVNPNGEWGWLQKTCGLPISDAITDSLCNPRTPIDS